MTSLLVIGFISILGQVVLLRELSVAFFGVELIYFLAIAAWLFWTALGAAAGQRRMQPSNNQIGYLFLLFAASLPAEIAGIRALRVLFAAAPGAYLSFPVQIISMSLSLLPAGLLSGWIFQWSAKRYIGIKETLARAYAIECLGGLAGGLASVALFHFGISNLAAGLVCSLLAISLPLALSAGKRLVLLRILGSLLFLGLIPVLWKSEALDRRMTQWNHPGLLDSKDSPYGRITLTQLHGQIAVFENDALSFETEGTGAEEFVHLAALQHPYPARVVILGGGIEGTVGEILQHSPELVDYVELNQTLLEMVTQFSPEMTRKALGAQNVHVFSTDPRQFLAKRYDKYDLILIGMPEPSSGQSNRFFTREFFALSASRLSPGGILAFKIRSSENFWTPQLRHRMASIYQAMLPAFRDVIILPGTTNIILASRGSLTRDPAVIAQRFHARSIRARMVSENFIRYLYDNDRFNEIAETLQKEPSVPNTDATPSCYRFTVMIWLSKFVPEAAFLDTSILSRSNLPIQTAKWLLFGILLTSFFFSRGRLLLRYALLTACAAAIGMALETCIMMQYQIKSGVLYQDIGLLLTAFMAGLAVGAWICDYWHRIPGGAWNQAPWAGIAFLAGLEFASVLFGRGIETNTIGGLSACSLLMGISGFLVAGTFAYAAARAAQDQRRAVGPLYAADLVGGCLGSIAVSLFLIPFAGLDAAAMAMIPLGLAALALV